MKKLLTLTLALMMVLSIAACGGNDKPDPSGADSGTQQEQSGNIPDSLFAITGDMLAEADKAVPFADFPDYIKVGAGEVDKESSKTVVNMLGETNLYLKLTGVTEAEIEALFGYYKDNGGKQTQSVDLGDYVETYYKFGEQQIRICYFPDGLTEIYMDGYTK